MNIWSGKVFATVFTAILLAGCITKETVTLPNLLLHFIDTDRQPILETKATLYWWELPYQRLHSKSVYHSDASGSLSIEETTQVTTDLLLLPHGVRDYNWTFCVEREGFLTVIGTVYDTYPGEKIEIWITLGTGERADVCDDYENIFFHEGIPRPDIKSSGGVVREVYEVYPKPEK